MVSHGLQKQAECQACLDSHPNKRSRGISNTFGVYQTYYESGELFTASSSQISWVGSIQAFLLLLVGALTGPIYDAGYVRSLLFSGTFLIVFGQMMLSLCHTYWQVMLSQAICIGIGAGCLFVPAVAIISTYFNTRIATAIGLAASGSSLGEYKALSLKCTNDNVLTNSRWCDISDCFSQAITVNWFRLGDKSTWLSGARHAPHRIGLHAGASSPSTYAQADRLVRLQGTSLYVLGCRRFL